MSRDDAAPPAAEAVPSGVRVAAAWAWRLLIIVAAIAVVGAVLVRLYLLTGAFAAALLLAAGLQPLAARLVRAGVPRLVAAWLTLLGFLGVLGLAGWLIGRAVMDELDDLQASVVEGIDRVRDWLVTGPLALGSGEIDDFADRVISSLTDDSSRVTDEVLTVATTATHVVTGVLLSLFILFFLLADGRQVWLWTTRLLPRHARLRVDEAGQASWSTLTAYVRGIVVVALCDAVLIAIVLWVVGVPLVLPLAALTFFGAFVPVVGATVAGTAAVLVALVDQGVTAALVVGAAVLAVQWIDSDVLQPIVVGRAVEVHPLAIGVGVTLGTLVAGIGGAVVAVPLIAAVNTAVVSLRGGADGDTGTESETDTGTDTGTGTP
ncbi:MAG: AI-2E family transporter [Actinomycetes bacterium]